MTKEKKKNKYEDEFEDLFSVSNDSLESKEQPNDFADTPILDSTSQETTSEETSQDEQTEGDFFEGATEASSEKKVKKSKKKQKISKAEERANMTEEEIKALEEKEAEEKKKRKKKRKVFLGVFLTVFLLLAVGAGFGYFFYVKDYKPFTIESSNQQFQIDQKKPNTINYTPTKIDAEASISELISKVNGKELGGIVSAEVYDEQAKKYVDKIQFGPDRQTIKLRLRFEKQIFKKKLFVQVREYTLNIDYSKFLFLYTVQDGEVEYAAYIEREALKDLDAQGKLFAMKTRIKKKNIETINDVFYDSALKEQVDLTSINYSKVEDNKLYCKAINHEFTLNIDYVVDEDEKPIPELSSETKVLPYYDSYKVVIPEVIKEGYEIVAEDEDKFVKTGIKIDKREQTIKIRFTRKKYTLKFVLDGYGATKAPGHENDFEQRETLYGLPLNLPGLDTLTKEDYVFLGWSKQGNPDENAELVPLDKNANENLVLYPVFRKEFFTVTVSHRFFLTEANIPNSPAKQTAYRMLKVRRGEFDIDWLAQLKALNIEQSYIDGYELTPASQAKLHSEVSSDINTQKVFLDYITKKVTINYDLRGGQTMKLVSGVLEPSDILLDPKFANPVFGYATEELPNNIRFVRPGYDFLGFYFIDSKNVEREFKFAQTPVTENLNVYAKWLTRTDTKYYLEYYGEKLSENNEYELIGPKRVEKTGKTESPVSHPAEEINGYYFANSPLQILDGNIEGDGSLVLKAYYKRNRNSIKFNLTGGTYEGGLLSDIEGVMNGQKIGPDFFKDHITGFDIKKLKKTEKLFKHWSETENGDPIDFNTMTMPNNPLTIYAVWQVGIFDIEIYHLTEKYSYASEFDRYEIREKRILRNVPYGPYAIEKLVLNGFDITPESNDLVNNYEVLVDPSTHKVEIKYNRKVYHIEYNKGDNAVFNDSFYQNPKYTQIKFENLIPYDISLTRVVRTGYTFKHWSASPNGLAFDFGTSIRDNLTLYAVWEPLQVNYTTQYYVQSADNENDYSELKNQIVQQGFSGTTVEATIKTFTGFELTQHNEEIRRGVVKGDGTLILKVYYNRKKYSLVFQTGLSPELPSHEIAFGKSLLPYKPQSNPTKPNYEFIRWGSDGSSTSPEFDFNTQMPSSNVFVYAIWRIKEYEAKVIHSQEAVKIHNNSYFETVQTTTMRIRLGEPFTVQFLSLEGFDVNSSDLAAWTNKVINENQVASNQVINIKYNRKIYRITYEKGEGASWIGEGDPNNNIAHWRVSHGNLAKLPNATIIFKNGYIFKHWSMVDGGPEYLPTTGVTHNMTLYAVFEQVPPTNVARYRIQYWYQSLNNPSEYELDHDDKKQGKVGDHIDLQNLEIPGFEKINHAGSVEQLDLVAAGSSYDTNTLKLYFNRKQYKLNVRTWNSLQQPVITEYNVSYGTKLSDFLTSKNIPLQWYWSEEGEVVAHSNFWTLETEGNNQIDVSNFLMPNQNIQIQPKLEYSKFTYKVLHMTEKVMGGFDQREIKTYIFSSGQHQVNHENYTGYEVYEGTDYNVEVYEVNSDITLNLNVKYIYYRLKKYSVHYNFEKGEYNNQSQTDPNTVSNFASIKYSAKIPTEVRDNEKYHPTRKHSEFIGWSLTPKGNLIDFNSYTITNDIEVYAKWKVNIASYTTEYYFEKLDGSGYILDVSRTTVQEFQVGQTVNATVFEVPGFDHTTTPNGGSSNLTGQVDEDGNLKLRVYYNRKIAKITFDSKGAHEGNPPLQTIKFGGKATNPGSVTKEGYEFKYWRLESDQLAFDFDRALDDPNNFGDRKIVAEWLGNEVNYAVYLKYESSDGTYPGVGTLDPGIHNGRAGETIPIKINGTIRDGYYIDPDSPTTITLSHIASLNVVEIKLKRKLYTVNFYETIAGTKEYNDLTQLVKYEGKVIKPLDNPTRIGYVFRNWTDSPTGGNAFDFQNYIVRGNLKLYAQWDELTYTINLNLNGGYILDSNGNKLSGEQTISKQFSSLPFLLPTPRNGTDSLGNGHDSFKFLHWQVNGETQTIEQILVASMITRPDQKIELIAVYEENPTPKVGEYYLLGSYPQAKVNNHDLLEKLNQYYGESEGRWLSSWNQTGDRTILSDIGSEIYERVATAKEANACFLRVERRVRVFRVINSGVLAQFANDVAAMQNQFYVWETVYYENERYERRVDNGDVNWYKYEPVKWRETSVKMKMVVGGNTIEQTIYLPIKPIDKVVYASEVKSSSPVALNSSHHQTSWNISYIRAYMNFALLAKMMNPYERDWLKRDGKRFTNKEEALQDQDFIPGVYSGETLERLSLLSEREFSLLKEEERVYNFDTLGINSNSYYSDKFPTKFWMRTVGATDQDKEVRGFTKDGYAENIIVNHEIEQGIIPAVRILS